MKIAVVAANGRVAQKVVKEAQDRGFEVTGFAREDENKSGAATYIKKDIMDLTKDDLADFDAVVDGFGAWKDEDQPMHVKTSQHLCDLLSGTDTRLLIVGGAGSLYVNAEHTAQVSDGPEFPDIFKPLASAMAKALGELRERNDV
ncbi:MAG: NAD(P)H-binding protein, partial [Oscillospiraceae bacterium]|nr:NAD(P)H-binding protein [Oscillospiraceae bacterium]